MVFAGLILSFSVYAYTVFYGTPWTKQQHEENMKNYIKDKYHTEFVLTKLNYNFLSETYQGYAYPTQHSNLLFIIEEDMDSALGYSDNYPKVMWDSELAKSLKAQIKELFPELDEGMFKALQIKDKAELFGVNIPSYEETNISTLSTSIPIDIKANWAQVNQKNEIQKMKKLSQFLQEADFPVLMEVRYYETEMNEQAKVFFITETGEIIEK
ncbi:hypothetical protein P9D43_03700 [Neobacillus niacini]|uniref:YfjL-like protein n=1 Tax=Neobacillus niacini TaxID=86668 RepID=UPI0007AB9E5D|nr:hypothetical protein [Neobacillus niacini]MEC1521142.1 hypothetical protein [Neobacillus niacini]